MQASVKRAAGSIVAVGKERRAVSDALTVAGFTVGWKVIQHLPERLAYRLFDTVADATARRGGNGVQLMRRNYRRLRPELSEDELTELVRAGVRSYLRYWCDAFRLPGMSRDVIRDSVSTSGDEAFVRAAVANRESIVFFLGHMGNWDLAGAWSATELAHVTTVAEKLEPEEIFRKFFQFREGLGMTIIPLVKGGGVLKQVEAVLRAPGGFAPLLSDRDLTSGGVEVTLAGYKARVAAGPAVLAARTGAHLIPVSITYAQPMRGGRRGILIHFHDAVHVSGASGAEVQRATQACVDALGTTLTSKTEEWHMMQPVFLDDLDASRLARPLGESPA